MLPNTPRQLRRSLIAFCLLGCALLLAPAIGYGAIITVGSPLAVPATLNTAEGLHYQGLNTAVPPSPEAPNGIFHTFHYGADTALWNVESPGGQAAMPTSGQALKISLEGCAVAAAGGPSPLTQIHFQDISPLPGGGARVNISSGAFDIPICGQGGASGSTVTTYEPFNLCVSQGDYIAFNDEGGYVENVYRNGVPYEVLGSVAGASADSFIRGNGTGNEAVFSPTDVTAMDGFAANQGEELMMQVLLGTGADARYVCAGGSKEAPPVLAPMRISPQTDGVNHSRIVNVAVYCRPAAGCRGTASLTLLGAGRGAGSGVGHASFFLPGDKTSHLPIRVNARLMGLIRKRHGITTTFVAVMDGKSFTQSVTIKIF